jgi:hypothetical protein
MRSLWIVLRTFLWTLFCSKAETFAKLLAFQQQLTVYTRKRPIPKLKKRDRLFWMALSKLWPGSGWKESLVIVQPETVIRWHHKGFCTSTLRRTRRWNGRFSRFAKRSRLEQHQNICYMIMARCSQKTSGRSWPQPQRPSPMNTPAPEGYIERETHKS